MLVRKQHGNGDDAEPVPPTDRESGTGSEPEMTEPRPTLQVWIDDECGERDRPEPAHDVRELERGDDVDRTGDGGEREHLRPRQQAGRKLASRGSRIACV